MKLPHLKPSLAPVIVLFFSSVLCVPAFASSAVSLTERIERLETAIKEQQELLESQQILLESLKDELVSQKASAIKTLEERDQEIKTLRERIDEEFGTTPTIAVRDPKAFNIEGRVQVRYQAIDDNGDDLSVVTNQNCFDDSSEDGFAVRRMRLQFFGHVTDRWYWHVQISGDGDANEDKVDPDIPDYELVKDGVGIKLQDAFIKYRLNPHFNITFGQFKSRFSPSYLTTGPYLPLCERPLVIDKLARKREIGISIESATGGVWDGRGYYEKPTKRPFYYALGIYNGNTFNRMRNDNENMMYSAMVMINPFKGFRLGASYAYDEKGTDEETTILGDPELETFFVEEDGRVNWEEYYAYPGRDGTVGEDLDLWDVNCALDFGNLHLQYEYISQDGSHSHRAYGFGIEGQLDLIDWLNAMPFLKDWTLWETVRNVQLTWRYDEFDPNVKIKNSFDSQWYTVGCNLFIHDPHVKWQINYTHRDEMHGEEVDNNIFYSHFQLLF
jgi:hypothetical protein